MTTWTSETTTTLKATSQSEDSPQKTPTVESDESIQTTEGDVQSQEDNLEHSVVKYCVILITFGVSINNVLYE